MRWLWMAAVGLALSGCEEQIHHGLAEREANLLQTVLGARGIAARKRPEGTRKPTWSLEVDRGHAAEAIRVLAELGLPQVREDEGCAGPGGLVKSPLEEQLCRIRGLERGVEKTLEGASGVLTARVHLVMPAPARWGQAIPSGKASVLVRVLPGTQFLPRESLKALVAGAVEGLAPDAVSLWVDEVRSLPARPELPPRTSPASRVWLGMLGLGVTALSVALLGVTLRRGRVRPVHEGAT